MSEPTTVPSEAASAHTASAHAAISDPVRSVPPASGRTGTASVRDATDLRVVDVAVGGMTCASCVARVEKKLGRLDGVRATVNLATESGRVTAPASVTDEDIVAAIARAGYTGTVTSSEPVTVSGAAAAPASDPPASDSATGTDQAAAIDLNDQDAPGSVAGPSRGSAARRDGTAPRIGASQVVRAADLRRRLIVSLVLSVPVMVLSMVPATQFTGWQWVVAALALPVVTWGAWPFHKAAFRAARHGASTMDTLVSLGVGAATAWSLWALTLGGAGELGMRMPMEFLPRAQSGHPHMYFESAAWVTTFLLAGRYAEARARYRSGDALRALLELGAKEVTRVRLASPSGSTDAVDVLDDEGAPRPDAARSR